MRRTMVLWEAYVTRFEAALERYRLHRLSADEAGEVLGMSGRQFRRLCVRYEEAGVDGLRDRRLGRASGRRAPASELERMHRLYVEGYADYSVKHFHEALVERHGYRLGYTVTRLSLQAAGLVTTAKRRVGVHRKKRPRRPLPGMMLFQDGSTHRWLPGLGHDLDLVVTLDDATSAITSALLVAEEGTASSFLGLGETIAGYGLFGSAPAICSGTPGSPIRRCRSARRMKTASAFASVGHSARCAIACFGSATGACASSPAARRTTRSAGA